MRAVSAPSGFVTPEAPTRAELSACVACGLCLPHCPTFRLTGRESASPRGRLAVMGAVLDGVLPLDADADEVFSFCLQCRACEAVCPGLVPFGRAMEGARAELTVQRPTPARRFRRLILGRVLPSRAAMRLVTAGARVLQALGGPVPARLRRGFLGLRPLRVRRGLAGESFAPRKRGAPRGTVGLLAGCVMDPWFPGVHEATVDLLTRAGFRVVVPAAQTCCGALAAHDGHAGEARRLAAANAAAFAGCDLLVSDAAGCTAHLKDHGDGLPPVRDVTELVAELIAGGVLPRIGPGRGPVAVQDPCHLRHAQRIVDAPRAILRAGGFEPVEIDPDGLCCGAAGIYSLLEPEASAELGTRKAAQVVASGASIVASANPGCEIQLRGYLGSGFRIAHPVELYREALTELSSTEWGKARG